ncbi:MAG TPA: hypothetical protein VJ417_10635, partial [Candidatus Glassbacteria bacterium]|nr:hypothetical protein [Candidatus Glassbacteria bacterium]
MELSDYKLYVTDNYPEAASRVMGTLSARGMKPERIGRLPRIERIAEASEVILVIITGGVHEKSTIDFL